MFPWPHSPDWVAHDSVKEYCKRTNIPYLMYKYRFRHIGMHFIKDQIDAGDFLGKIVFLAFDRRYEVTQCMQIAALFAVEDTRNYAWLTNGADIYQECDNYERRKELIERPGALVIQNFAIREHGFDPIALNNVCIVIKARKALGYTTYLDGGGKSFKDAKIAAWGLDAEVTELFIPVPEK